MIKTYYRIIYEMIILTISSKKKYVKIADLLEKNCIEQIEGTKGRNIRYIININF